MPRTIRFHLDEHVPDSVAKGLRQRGIEVSTTDEASLSGADDREHCQYAVTTGRAILTFDSDYLDLHSQGVEHHGIPYVIPSRNRDIGGIIRHAQLVWEVLEPQAQDLRVGPVRRA